MILDTSCTCRGVLGLIGAPCPVHAHDPAVHVPKERLEPNRCRAVDERGERCGLVSHHEHYADHHFAPRKAQQEAA